MSITYRQAEPADIPSLARIRASEWGGEDYWTARITGYLEGTHNPQKALPPRILYVALEEEMPIGFIAGHLTERFGCDGELEWINVSPEHRGSETASALFHLLAAWFVTLRATRVCVNCDEENSRAYRFYTRHGAVPLKPHWLVWVDIGLPIHLSHKKSSPITS